MAAVPAAPALRAPRPARPGFTLLELVIALAVVVVLAALSVPSLGAVLARHRLLSAAQLLAADLAAARHEAARRGLAVHLVTQEGRGWCYGLALRPDADCQRGPEQDSALLKTVHARDTPGVLLLSAAPFATDPRRALPPGALDGHARFANLRGQQVLVQRSAMGRASLCAGTSPLPGLPACPPVAPP